MPCTVCAIFRHCEHDRHALEATNPGLTSCSPGFGASVGETRFCWRRDQLISPGDSCGKFEAPCVKVVTASLPVELHACRQASAKRDDRRIARPPAPFAAPR